MAGDVVVGVPVGGVDAVGVAGLVGSERHTEFLALREIGMPAEVGQRLSLLFTHVFAVRLSGCRDTFPPGVGADVVACRLGDGGPDAVVIGDRVPGLLLGVVGVRRAGANVEQQGVEQLLLCGRMHLEQDAQTLPDRCERVGVPAIDVVEQGEHAALFVVIFEDERSDVHRASLPAPTGRQTVVAGRHDAAARISSAKPATSVATSPGGLLASQRSM